ncbi:MAG: autotransporter outer membrane beta-barrel domain-containing protein [Scandinavium sp.]|uniref:autotransporter outer membrane beta-barrel domain-containing protein n=1 Tax=Scandinavium sp. TaxID=2830653 RepID=UPI003F3E1113
MHYSNQYSRIAIAVSTALASMVFSAHAGNGIDFDNLPNSGLVSSLPPELQALIPGTANTTYQKVSSAPNYVYAWDGGTLNIYGDNVTLNGPGQEAFEHTITVIRNSTSGSPGVIFGDGLTINTASKVAANAGKDVDGIRTHGTNTPDNPVFIITGDRTSILVNGYSGDGINAGYSSFSQGSLGSASIYTGNELYIETTGDQGRGISVYALKDATQAKNSVITGDAAHIITRGSSAEGIRTGQSGSWVRLGERSVIETYGSSSYGLYATSSSLIELGKGATISTDNKTAHAVYAYNKGVISLDDNASITTHGDSAHGVYAYSSGIANLGDGARVDINSTGKTSASAKAPMGLYAYSRGAINLAGGATITMAGTAADESYALFASNGGLIDASSGGQFTIKGDILSSGSATASSSNPLQYSTIALNMTDNSLWNGASAVDGGATLDLTMSNTTWNMTNSSTLTSLTLNAGSTVNFQHADDNWQTLTINQDYVGNGGKLVFNTVLFDDDSDTDKLIVNGSTSGNTLVAMNNIGGTGAQTVEGIEIIEVNGSSDGAFEKSGRIVAGGFDYNLEKKAGNWYLTSLVEPEDPIEPPDPIDPPDPVDPVDPPAPVDPVDPPAPVDPVEPETPVPPTPPAPEPTPAGEHQYRPEFGSYLANNYAANTLFLTRLHDRLGETQYTDMLTGEQKVTSMWMRNVGGHTRFKDGSGQLKTQSNRYVLQLGGDLAQWSNDGLDRWHLGVMAGYANSQSRTHSSLTGYHSRGQITGYSAGVYATWYANDADKTGTYVDSWALYNWFDNKVMGQDLATEKYKSKGVTASVEAGYSLKLGGSGRDSYWLQPKAQLVWMDVQADDHREENGSRVKDDTDGNLLTRLGVKAYIKGHNALDDDKAREFQPFVEANWIHNTRNVSVKMDDIRNEMRGTKNIGELKLGVEGQLTPRLNVWGNVAQQMGDKGYSDTQGMLGVKYNF